MSAPSIVIATPHSRYDELEERVRARLGGYHVLRLRDKDELSYGGLCRIKPDFVFFPHWSWRIPQAIHSQFCCVILHMTDLPYGRGGSPLQNLIVRGHKETQLTALRCVSELDAGPVYLKRPLSLAGTAEDILRRASKMMADMICFIVTDRPEAVPQEGRVVEFSRRRPEDGDLSPLEDLEKIYDFIRMLDADGYPAAFIETEHLHIELRAATLDGKKIEARVRIRRKND